MKTSFRVLCTCGWSGLTDDKLVAESWKASHAEWENMMQPHTDDSQDPNRAGKHYSISIKEEHHP